MSREIVNELVSFLLQPGKLSQMAWNDAYYLVVHTEMKGDVFLYQVVSVASRVARARKVRLPEVLHNIMALYQSSPNLGAGRLARAKKFVSSYMKMVSKLPKASLEENKPVRIAH